MDITVNSNLTGTVMLVDQANGIATLNLGSIIPAKLTIGLMIGSPNEQAAAFKRLRTDDQIEVTVVSVPAESDTNGNIIVRQRDSQLEEAQSRLTDGVIVEGSISSVTADGATVVVDGVRIFVPVRQIEGRGGKLRSLRPGDALKLQITGRKQHLQRGLLIYGSQRNAIMAEQKEKHERTIASLQTDCTNHSVFRRPIKAVTDFGVFIHVMRGVDGLLGRAKMDKATVALFDQKRLNEGGVKTEIGFEIERMKEEGGKWRLQLNQKIVPVRKVHEAICSEELAREGVVIKLLDSTQTTKASGKDKPNQPQVVIELDGVYGLLGSYGIPSNIWRKNIYRLGARVKVYSTSLDVQHGQLVLAAAKI